MLGPCPGVSVGGCGSSHLPYYLLGGLSLGLRSGDGGSDLDWEEREASMAGPRGHSCTVDQALCEHACSPTSHVGWGHVGGGEILLEGRAVRDFLRGSCCI